MKKPGISGEVEIRETLIIAHRGAPGDATENTIESFAKALVSGADMIEFDVRRTKDKVLIAFHDEMIQGQAIKDHPYEEICQRARNQGFDIPTVEDVLKWSRGRIRLDVELKEEGYEKEIVELLHRYSDEDRLVITSFSDDSLRVVKEQCLDIKTGLILGRNLPSYRILTRLQELFPERRCQEAKPDFLVAHLHLLRLGFLERARRRRLPVFVWTVNDEETIRSLLDDERVYGIITDNLDLAVSLRRKTLQVS